MYMRIVIDAFLLRVSCDREKTTNSEKSAVHDR